MLANPLSLLRGRTGKKAEQNTGQLKQEELIQDASKPVLVFPLPASPRCWVPGCEPSSWPHKIPDFHSRWATPRLSVVRRCHLGPCSYLCLLLGGPCKTFLTLFSWRQMYIKWTKRHICSSCLSSHLPPLSDSPSCLGFWLCNDHDGINTLSCPLTSCQDVLTGPWNGDQRKEESETGMTFLACSCQAATSDLTQHPAQSHYGW